MKKQFNSCSAPPCSQSFLSITASPRSLRTQGKVDQRQRTPFHLSFNSEFEQCNCLFLVCYSSWPQCAQGREMCTQAIGLPFVEGTTCLPAGEKTPGLFPHLSGPTAGAGENQSVPPSSWWTHTLLWLSPRSWLSSWGSVQTPPGSTSLLLPEAGESVPPFWPVLADTRTSLQALPSLQTCMATCRGGGWEHHPQLLYAITYIILNFQCLLCSFWCPSTPTIGDYNPDWAARNSNE